MQTIHLNNEYPGILDLSAVSDVEGKRVVLQPKGADGDSRECYADVADHPHVQTFLAAGRVSVQHTKEYAEALTPAPRSEAPPVVVETVQLQDATTVAESVTTAADIVEAAVEAEAAEAAAAEEGLTEDASADEPAAEEGFTEEASADEPAGDVQAEGSSASHGKSKDRGKGKGKGKGGQNA